MSHLPFRVDDAHVMTSTTVDYDYEVVVPAGGRRPKERRYRVRRARGRRPEVEVQVPAPWHAGYETVWRRIDAGGPTGRQVLRAAWLYDAEMADAQQVVVALSLVRARA